MATTRSPRANSTNPPDWQPGSQTPAGLLLPPRGGNIFKRDWFQYVERLPEGIERRAGMDLAAGAKERSDYTSYIEVAEDANLNLYIVGCFRERLEQGHRAWLTGKPSATTRPRPVNDRTVPSQQDAEPASGLREVHVPDIWIVAAAVSLIG